MHIASAHSVQKDSLSAISTTYASIAAELKGTPDLLFLHCSVTYDGDVLMRYLREVAPGVPLHGATSCTGVMSDQGHHSQDDTGLALMGVKDPGGAYGVGVAILGDNPRAAATAALERALDQAERPGEAPALVWIAPAPGSEESVLLGIEDAIGGRVPIAGGSSADNDVTGKWSQFANGQVFQNAVVITVLFPSTEVLFAFHSGYEPTRICGRITKASERVLLEIDGRPAAQVYNEWTNGSITAQLESGGNILGSTSLHPLGREVGQVGTIPYYQLSHPDSVTPEGGLSLFTQVSVGEELVLMEGSTESLVSRAGRVARALMETQNVDPSEVAGSLVVFCAGCMLTVRDQMPHVARGLSAALANTPFIGMYTFGEQGCFVGGENRHGNLMISVLMFRR